MWNIDQNAVFEVWPEAEELPILTYQSIMETANALCAAYAPSPALDAAGNPVIPDSWKMAEILQARHIWSQNGRGNSDTFGPDGLQISTYSLVMTARDILRPKSSPLRRIR